MPPGILTPTVQMCVLQVGPLQPPGNASRRAHHQLRQPLDVEVAAHDFHGAVRLAVKDGVLIEEHGPVDLAAGGVGGGETQVLLRHDGVDGEEARADAGSHGGAGLFWVGY